MQVLEIASRKGGSGKTTLTGHLAVEAERQGIGPVAIMDIDPQGSLADWWNERQADTPSFVNTTLDTLEHDIDKLRKSGVRLLVIDTPPAITRAIRDVIRVSDMVLIPTRPSPHDLRAVAATVAMVEESGKPLVFVLNAATPRARITNEAIVALSQHGPLAPSIVHQRVDFASSMIDGRTVMEASTSSLAIAEIECLWKYLAIRLDIMPRLDDVLIVPGAGGGGAVRAVAQARLL
ncbi:MAG: ParA family protein [Proteobacteria bacterium]|nr:ParA family protein [Pseudomonadota bacterium]